MSRRLFSIVLAVAWLFAAGSARAAVTITFWSHEFGNGFPHAFFTLRGVPDAGGVPVNGSYGFTAKAVTPALLMGSVAGKLEYVKPAYVESSDAQFSVVLTDPQYREILALLTAWDDRAGNGRYNLNKRNCIHFVKEAARIAGLTDLDRPKLMKRPRSYLKAIEAANAAAVIAVGMPGKTYLAGLPPLDPTPAVPPAEPTLVATTRSIDTVP